MAEISDPQRDFSSRLLSQYRGRTLRRGDKSKTTRALQLFLREQGYDIKADGAYGPATEKAVREWQKANGLSADGQFGKRSLTKARENITPTPKERPTAVPRGDFAPLAEPVEPMETHPMAGISNIPAGLGGARPVPRPSFEPNIVAENSGMGGMSAKIGAGMPLPAPAAPQGDVSAAYPALPPTPAPEAPVEPPPDMAQTVPSDLNPEQLRRVHDINGLGPAAGPPPEPTSPSPLASALTRPPPTASPELMGASSEIGGLPPLNDPGAFPAGPALDPGSMGETFPQPPEQALASRQMSPETIALMQALMARMQPQPPQAGM